MPEQPGPTRNPLVYLDINVGRIYRKLKCT